MAVSTNWRGVAGGGGPFGRCRHNDGPTGWVLYMGAPDVLQTPMHRVTSVHLTRPSNVHLVFLV